VRGWVPNFVSVLFPSGCGFVGLFGVEFPECGRVSCGSHVSVTFGSFSIICFSACCWVFVVVGVAVLCLVKGGFLSLSITISLCMACK
jgi:hypothetical protein